MRSALDGARLAHAARPFDLLAVIRGGGASTDLAWLNDLDVARALANFPVPVVTGIGHARDDTILDEVAAVRCDTPSKAVAWVEGRVRDAAVRAEAKFARVREVGRDVVRAASADAERARTRTLRAASSLVEREAAEVDHLMRQVLGLTPQRTLARGYALVRARGAVVPSAARARQEARLSLEFRDGTVQVTPSGVGEERDE
ncbi:exodeoxyribonuclease VII large subunit [Deinococcus pimensis]|uniref:exodeoxyribonuclease VII large subunit n=1 Tax=Deinococcus pimensis TaxID=309888 RepID=UPI00316ADC93